MVNFYKVTLKKISLSFIIIGLSFIAKSQTTITIYNTGIKGSFNSGYVKSAGAKTEGNEIVDGNTTLRSMWANFNLSSILTRSTINFSINQTTN